MVIYKHDRGVELGSTEKQLQGLEPATSRFQVRRANHSASLPSKLFCTTQPRTGFCERYLFLNVPLLCIKRSLLLLQKTLCVLEREQKSRRTRGWWGIDFILLSLQFTRGQNSEKLFVQERLLHRLTLQLAKEILIMPSIN